MAISLYTSRVVLNQLGVSDYGIYGLVGGFVAIFSFLNSSMGAATSRFLTVALAKGDSEEIQKTFRAALIAHIIIALVFLVLAQTIGLWFVCTQLNIPSDRTFAAQIVYQLSVVSSLISITQVPYNATLIAHERMDIYAWLDIISAFLKLGAALLLFIHWFDSLIVYAFLIFIIGFLIAMTYRLICVRMYSECRFKWIWDAGIGKSLLHFSSWNLYCQFCFVGRQQGTNVLLNRFGSTLVNAAAGLATTIQGVLEQVSTNVIMAARPQLIAQYAVNKHKEMIRLMSEVNLMANSLFLMAAIPFVANVDFLLRLWLKNVPPYLAAFSVLTLAASFLNLTNNLVATCVQASGKIRKQSLLTGTLSILVLPVVWLIFRNGGNLSWAYIVPVLTKPVGYMINAICLKDNVSTFRYIRYYVTITMRSVLIAILPVISIVAVHTFFDPSLQRVLFDTAMAIILCGVGALTFGLQSDQRTKVISTLLIKIGIRKNG